MVKKALQFLYKETSALHEAAYLLGLFAILSQVLAFLRDRLLAHVFGASAALDTYYAAFRIPDFLFSTIGSVVMISILVPFIVDREKISHDEVRKFIDDIFTFFSYLIIGVCVIAFFLIPPLSGVLFKGFSGKELSDVIMLSRILLLSPIFLGFSNLLGSLTQAYNRFLIYAFAPLVYNAGIILGILFLSPHIGIYGVAVGVAVGAFLHMAVQIPFVIQSRLMPRPKFSFRFDSVKDVAKLSMPRTLSLSTNHIATIFLVSLASLMATGSISIYSFALNLQSVPLSIIGVSYSLAAFPTLTRHYANNDLRKYVDHMADTARHIIFWSLPAMALFIILRAQIVRVLLGTGRFSWDDTRLTAAALALFSLSALSQCLLLLFTRAFYSAGQTLKPFLINFISTVALLIATYILVKVYYVFPPLRDLVGISLRVGGLPTVVLMLPLGYSIGTIINAIIHWVGFEREFGGFSKQVMRTFYQLLGASIFVAAGAYAGLNIFAHVFNISTLMGIFLQGLCAGIMGIIVGAAVLILMGNRELKETWSGAHRRFWKAEVIADPEVV